MVVLKGAVEVGIKEFDIGPHTAPAIGCILGRLCQVHAPKVPLFLAERVGRICSVCQQILCCDVCRDSPEHQALDEFMVHGARPQSEVKTPYVSEPIEPPVPA